MTTFQDVIIVDIFSEVVASMKEELRPVFLYGKNPQIAVELQKLTESQSKIHPLLALYMPFDEIVGSSTSYFCEAMFPRISISALTVCTDSPEVRYTKVYKPVLYPVLNEFLTKFCQHIQVVTKDKYDLRYTKRDTQGVVPASAQNNYIDAIEMFSFKTKISQIVNC